MSLPHTHTATTKPFAFALIKGQAALVQGINALFESQVTCFKISGQC